jgi:hypothetical protein
LVGVSSAALSDAAALLVAELRGDAATNESAGVGCVIEGAWRASPSVIVVDAVLAGDASGAGVLTGAGAWIGAIATLFGGTNWLIRCGAGAGVATGSLFATTFDGASAGASSVAFVAGFATGVGCAATVVGAGAGLAATLGAGI